ncbi:MAG: hypothetical protein ACK4V6_08650, partial [Microthrixaceae bacterium]
MTTKRTSLLAALAAITMVVTACVPADPTPTTTPPSTTSTTIPAGVSVTDLSASAARTCALLTDGTARCWGDGAQGALGTGTTSDSALPVMVAELTAATALTVGGSHACAV